MGTTIIYIFVSMKSIVILANGQYPRKEFPQFLLKSADAVVCCDGALMTAEKHGIVPDAVVGDLDSVCGRALRRYNGTDKTSAPAEKPADNGSARDGSSPCDGNGNCEIGSTRESNGPCENSDTRDGNGTCNKQRTVVRVSDQDTNDLTKALRYVLDTWPDADTIHIIGATGKSEAHTIGNISLLMEYESAFNLADKGISVDIVSDYSTIFAIAGSCELHVGEGRKVSIFSPDPSLRIESEGLVWPTDNVTFDNWWKGTLNRASSDIIKLKFNHPSKALVILD